MSIKLKTFLGGIHPPDQKQLSASHRIEDAPLPKRVYLPLTQHIGAPAIARVKVGQKVLKGEKIADSEALICAPIHASISGTVVDIKNHPHPSGSEVPTIIIESDGRDLWFQEPHNGQDPLELGPEEIRGMIREAGIVGLGGAAFPTHVKLSPPEGKPIDAIILNGAECEPYLTADYRLMVEKAKEIVQGLRILLHVLGVERGYIGIEANKPEAISAMSKAASSFPQIEVVSLKVRYPQGAEKQLIKTILNREVPPPPALPLDVGVVVQNVGTAYAIYEAVSLRKPLIERIVTVSGRGIKEPKNLRLRLGTLFAEAIGYCGGFQGKVEKILMGGPMMGLAQYTTRVPVIKGTSGILVLTKEECPQAAEASHCINCGLCVRACPMRLVPSLIGTFCEKGLLEEAEAYHVLDCIECGSCVYVCPAKRHLVHLMKYGKSAILAKKRKQPKA
ncbi:MAG: electron transport complex subunit RsxC [bacterium]|nr:electron transport complex subunit RsxC [bacterium]